MAIKPILFNTDMVKAILDGRKTQTRRLKKICEPGDILWVRETFDDVACGHPWYYKADGDLRPECWRGERWYPSIHMPKEAARIFLRVKDVREERLQDITEEAALAEGMPNDSDYPIAPIYCPRCKGEGFIGYYSDQGHYEVDCPMCDTAVKRFNNLWISTIKKADRATCDWDANPWLWVIEFERCDRPEGWDDYVR